MGSGICIDWTTRLFVNGRAAEEAALGMAGTTRNTSNERVAFCRK